MLFLFLYLAFTAKILEAPIEWTGPAKFLWFTVTYLLINWIYYGRP